jgi:hypothetical protein
MDSGQTVTNALAAVGLHFPNTRTLCLLSLAGCQMLKISAAVRLLCQIGLAKVIATTDSR